MKSIHKALLNHILMWDSYLQKKYLYNYLSYKLHWLLYFIEHHIFPQKKKQQKKMMLLQTWLFEDIYKWNEYATSMKARDSSYCQWQYLTIQGKLKVLQILYLPPWVSVSQYFKPFFMRCMMIFTNVKQYFYMTLRALQNHPCEEKSIHHAKCSLKRFQISHCSNL